MSDVYLVPPHLLSQMNYDSNIIYILDLVGTASFAFSGALRVLHKRVDIVGMTILAGATAIGGSVIRDVILNRQVLMLHDLSYPLIILASAFIAFLFPDSLRRNEVFFKYFDAVGLGVFAAIGAGISWQIPGINVVSVVFIAAISGSGGGVIRDVLLNEMPLILYKEVYVCAVVAGAAAFMITMKLTGAPTAGFIAGMSVTIAIRTMAIRWNWSLPRIR